MSSGPDGTTTSNGLHCVAGRPKSQSKHPLFNRTVPGARPQCGTYMYPSTVRPDVRELQVPSLQRRIAHFDMLAVPRRMSRAQPGNRC